MKTRKRGMGGSWAKAALGELHSIIEEERDSARWLRLNRALSRVEQAIEEADKIAVAAVRAERRLAHPRKKE